ncbi:MAG: acyl-ACP--UDP-N-acetylglucosamine O-acyltransferase [Holosporales bacterium]|jgi:UDP-N-acetylglucosamine acyltransferase|nr:acyl-ACP--UDP-N-acetylglucosamine O-acyltransferase [Holosporales bacterium]
MSVGNTSVIHNTAIVENGAVIGNNVFVGPYCCIGKDVIISDNVRLEPHVVIGENTKIGEGTVIYPFASIGQKPQDLKYNGEKARIEIGKNTVIREYVTVNIGTQGGGMLTKIGDDCLIMAYCHIAHDCIIGNHVILVNGVNLSGHVTIDDYAIIGGMSPVKQFIRIGKHAMIGGFTGVDRDVIPYGVVRSDRITTLKGINIIGLRRHGFSIDSIKSMINAYREIFEFENDMEQFTINLEKVEKDYRDDQYVSEIIGFIKSPAKNPICTTKPTDEE